MNMLEHLLKGFADAKLGSDFDERVMRSLENTSWNADESIKDMVEQYQAIIRLLSPTYTSVKLNADDLSRITIDETIYDLDDKSTPASRKATEHRQSIECLLADFEEDHSRIIRQIEARLNENNTR